MSDLWDFLTAILFCSGVIIFVFLIGIFIYCISGCAEKDELRQQQIHDCFVQEPRTKECEYILWQEELKAAKRNNSNSGSLATGLALGTVMGTTIRR